MAIGFREANQTLSSFCIEAHGVAEVGDRLAMKTDDLATGFVKAGCTHYFANQDNQGTKHCN
ncbi:hypothetical protein AWQ21_07515 [Picosynechococcus sp. PCC 7003]|nr:hypothetical protein AWQ21_07515 [Picosynechococcus sp. PCC 7003]